MVDLLSSGLGEGCMLADTRSLQIRVQTHVRFLVIHIPHRPVPVSSFQGDPLSKDIQDVTHTHPNTNLYDHTALCDDSVRSSFSVSSYASSGASGVKPYE